jgi:hypothetical protein
VAVDPVMAAAGFVAAFLAVFRFAFFLADFFLAAFFADFFNDFLFPFRFAALLFFFFFAAFLPFLFLAIAASIQSYETDARSPSIGQGAIQSPAKAPMN